MVRPKKKPADVRDKSFPVRMTAKERDDLHARCKKLGVDAAEILRIGGERYLAMLERRAAKGGE